MVTYTSVIDGHQHNLTFVTGLLTILTNSCSGAVCPRSQQHDLKLAPAPSSRKRCHSLTEARGSAMVTCISVIDVHQYNLTFVTGPPTISTINKKHVNKVIQELNK